MSAVRNAIIDEIDKMSERQLEDVLAGLRGKLRPVRKGISGAEFMKRFGGLIPPDELDRMDAAIERDCETVEPDNGR